METINANGVIKSTAIVLCNLLHDGIYLQKNTTITTITNSLVYLEVYRNPINKVLEEMWVQKDFILKTKLKSSLEAFFSGGGIRMWDMVLFIFKM